MKNADAAHWRGVRFACLLLSARYCQLVADGVFNEVVEALLMRHGIYGGTLVEIAAEPPVFVELGAAVYNLRDELRGAALI